MKIFPPFARVYRRRLETMDNFSAEAFHVEFVEESNVKALYDALQVVLRESTFARIASILQSSGWGKSRTICELHREKVWVVYCSLQQGKGYPGRSYIADWFCEKARSGLSRELRDQLVCMAFCLSFIISCVEQVAKVAMKGVGEGAFVRSLYTGDGAGKQFWDQVKQKTSERNPALLTQLDDALEKSAPGSRKDAFDDWAVAAQRIMQTFVRKLPYKDGLRLVIVFDEARALVGEGIDDNIFLPLRRATGALQQGDGILAILADTHSRITNFASPDWLDPSDRLALEAYTLASPVWACFCADIGVKQWADVCKRYELDKDDILSKYYHLQYGRPLWWAFFCGGLLGELLPENAAVKVINMARNKLLGGGSAWHHHFVGRKKKPLTESAALAVLGARCAIEIDPSCSLASKLVEAHLMTVVKVGQDREHIWVGTAMEPVLAQAAADVMRKLDDQKRSVELYSQLEAVLMAGKVDRGFKGELVARIILLRAFDKASRGESFCTVDDFIQQLVGKSLTDYAKSVRRKRRKVGEKVQVVELKSLNTEQLQEIGRGKLTFTAFHKIHRPSYKVDQCDIKECLLRRSAIICYDGTWGVDFFIPCLLSNGEVTVLHVQVKLRSSNSGDAGLAKVSPQYCGLQILDRLPFLSIYMNVGDVMGSEAVLVDPCEVEAALRKNKKTKALRLAIAAKDKEQAADKEQESSAEEELEDEFGALHLRDSVEQKQQEQRFYKAWLAWLNMARDNQVILKVTGLGAFEGVLGQDLLHLFRNAIQHISKVPVLDKTNELEMIQGRPLQSMFPVVDILKH